MLNKLKEVYEQYDFEVEKIIRGRGGYILYTNQGLKLLREYEGSVGKLDLEAWIKNGLKKEGFCYVDAPVLTKEKEYLAFDKYQTAYTLKEYFEGRECNLKNVEEIKIAAANLAKLHLSLRKLNDLWERKDGESLSQEMQRRNKECKRVKNYIRSLNKKNEFENLFLQNVDYFYQQGEETRKKLFELEQRTKGNREGICHGDYNQHNIVFQDKIVYTINFEKMQYGNQLMDLYHFLRKALEKNHYSGYIRKNILSAYSKESRLKKEDYFYLYYMLCYPEKFLKITNRYMNGRKTWIPPKNIEKMQQVIQSEKEKKRFLEEFFEDYLLDEVSERK